MGKWIAVSTCVVAACVAGMKGSPVASNNFLILGVLIAVFAG